jgi:hypothetical protein
VAESFVDLRKGGQYNSNTPLPKRYGTDCPANKSGVPCAGEKCLSRRKGCAYWVLRRNMIIGRQAIRELQKEGFEVL